MMFLKRKMRSKPTIRDYVTIATDRVTSREIAGVDIFEY